MNKIKLKEGQHDILALKKAKSAADRRCINDGRFTGVFKRARIEDSPIRPVAAVLPVYRLGICGSVCCLELSNIYE